MKRERQQLTRARNAILANTQLRRDSTQIKNTRFNRHTVKRSFLTNARIAAAATHITALPIEGESIHAIMDGRYNAFDLVPATLQLLELPINKLHLTTLGFNQQQAEDLGTLLDSGRVEQCDFICSEYYQDKEPGVCKLLKTKLAEKGGRFHAMRCHAKIMLMQAGEIYLTCETSANLRSCWNIEQFCLTRCKALYQFHADWMESVLSGQNPNFGRRKKG